MTLTVFFECVLPCISAIVYPDYENGQRKRTKGTELMCFLKINNTPSIQEYWDLWQIQVILLSPEFLVPGHVFLFCFVLFVCLFVFVLFSMQQTSALYLERCPHYYQEIYGLQILRILCFWVIVLKTGSLPKRIMTSAVTLAKLAYGSHHIVAWSCTLIHTQGRLRIVFFYFRLWCS